MIEQLGNDLIPVLAISLTFLGGIFWLACATVDSLYKTARDARIKEILIERGSSASEIERIVKAGSPSPHQWEVVEPAPPVKAHHV